MDIHICLEELVSRRYTQTEIANGTGVNQSTISRVIAGSGTTYENGTKIVAYYEGEKERGFVRVATVEQNVAAA